MEAFNDFGILFEFDTHHFGDDVTGDVILSWTQSATNDDGVAAIKSDLQRISNTVPVVTHFDLQKAIDSRKRKLLTDPRGIRIDDLSE
jgi:hypothetical protein